MQRAHYNQTIDKSYLFPQICIGIIIGLDNHTFGCWLSVLYFLSKIFSDLPTLDNKYSWMLLYPAQYSPASDVKWYESASMFESQSWFPLTCHITSYLEVYLLSDRVSIWWYCLLLFSCESSSRNANVCQSVCQSVCLSVCPVITSIFLSN